MALTPFMALRKMEGKAARHGWCVGSITFSATMAYLNFLKYSSKLKFKQYLGM